MGAPSVIVGLVEHFARNADVYRSNLNETELRVQFIDPFFEALGWDVHNKKHYAETYKDVIHEYSLRSAAHTEAPDYCFQVGGTRKFYVEAKRPAVHVSADPAPAYQLRSYAWTSKLPLSLLTNFAEFAVYDCRILPRPNDKPSVARVDLITFDQYPTKWNDIASRFSREAVYQGSFDRYTESSKLKKGTAEVDNAFLTEIESWRKELASNIAMRNTSLSQREVNFAVQRTIDRIIFLRICEDRGIERYGQLQELERNDHVYRHLCTIYERADEKYNSGLFHFTDEKDRAEAPDKLTPSLKIDDARLKPILKRLYYPDSPYQFSHFPADILGQVYEQFLGQVIRLTPGHQARVEPKPEVKKAGGVYYTPTYIVEYIVRNTIGQLLEGKTPKQASKLRILDPACGSGSFLLGAYQFLMDWHRDEYLKRGTDKHRKELYQTQGGDWRLTTMEKKRILLNNIYGVDIDSQAVEVTKLSLLLKVLEGESEQTIGTNLRIFHERALPDLGNNIKCGNSLIASDFYRNEQMHLLGQDEQFRINVFDWDGTDGFPEILNFGGFDAVIGNPPYLYSAGQEYADYFAAHYVLSQAQADFYVYFLEKALALCRETGLVSFIVSDAWLNSENFSSLRNHILQMHELFAIGVFDYPVFKDATLENSILFVSKSQKPSTIAVSRFSSPTNHTVVNHLDPHDAVERGLIDPRHSAASEKIVAKLESNSKPLESFVRLNRGIHAYRTDGYGQSAFGRGPQTARDKEEQSYHSDKKLNNTYLPEIKGKDVGRYTLTPTGAFLSYGPWLAEAREPEFFMSPKLAIRKILGNKLSGTFISGPMALDQSLYLAISNSKDEELLKHILGILLSSIGAWYFRTKYSIYDTLYPWYTKKQLSQFPMKPKNPKLVQLVDTALALNSSLTLARTDQERTALQRQFDAIDHQIDHLVFQLYGLTDREIGLVEGRDLVGF
jgi:hypothetical protein